MRVTGGNCYVEAPYAEPMIRHGGGGGGEDPEWGGRETFCRSECKARL